MGSLISLSSRSFARRDHTIRQVAAYATGTVVASLLATGPEVQ